MAIGFRNTQYNSTTGGTSLAVTKPTDTAEGDCLIACIVVEDTADRLNSVPEGWTECSDSVIGTRTHRQYIYWKVAGASEPASYTWGINATDEWAISISAFSGTHVTAPVGNVSASTANASATTATAPAITIQTANNWALVVASSMYGTTWSAPGGSPTYTERGDRRSGTGSSNISVSIHSAEYTSTGSTGTKGATAANADYWKATHVELKQWEAVPLIQQEGFRFRNDDGSESAATWLEPQDKHLNILSGLDFRLRVLLNEYGGSNKSTTTYQLEYKKNTDSYVIMPTSIGAETSETFTSNGSWTCPSNIVGTTIKVECWGGGGGGGGGDTGLGGQAGGGGGGGAYSKSNAITITPGNTYNYTVGSGGAGGSSSGGNGTTGGTTTFTGDSSVKCEAVGGNTTNNGTDYGASGGTGGAAASCTGDVKYSGGNGAAGTTTYSGAGGEGAGTTSNGGNASAETGGTGTDGGDGGRGANMGQSPLAGQVTGGGGGGAYANGYTGLAGARGQIKITYSLPTNPIYIKATGNITASGEATTAQLTAPSGKTTGDFGAGRIQDDENPADTIAINANKYTEFEWNLTTNPNVVNYKDIYYFRLTDNGTPINTYSIYPSINIMVPNPIMVVSYYE